MLVSKEIVREFHDILGEVVLKERQFHARLLGGKSLAVILEISFHGVGKG